MTQDNLQLDSAAITDKGLSEKRPQNEDSYLELRDSGLYAVADGVGGAQAGDVASQMAVEILGEAFINLQEDGDAEERMKSAINQANSAIFQTSHELAQLSTMATTIVALHINGNIATIGHVGDSRLYRLDEGGNLFRETQDHSVVEEEVRAGRMTPEQALTHPSRNVISRALGAEPNVEIDMKTIMFEPNTKFLVCSDGVTRHIPDEELKTLLMEDVDSALTCQTIKELCFQRGAEDNLTAVIVSIANAEADANAFISKSDTIEDFEEDTIATTRPPLVNSAVLANSDAGVAEIPTQQLRTPQNVSNELQTGNDDILDDDEIIIPTRDDSAKDSISISKTVDPQSTPEPVATKDIKSYTVENKGGAGILGSIISGIVWLLIGVLLGALGYYYWATTSNVNETATNQPGFIGITKPIFDQKKNQAITNPEKFIADNVNPKDSYDNYLLGIAYLLQGNFDSAKRELEKAENLLDNVPENDRAVLKNDISLAMDKVNSANKNDKSEITLPDEKQNENAKPDPVDSVEPVANNAPAGNDG